MWYDQEVQIRILDVGIILMDTSYKGLTIEVKASSDYENGDENGN